MTTGLKVALAHDYLKEYGGAERVLEVLHKIFPEAPLYTAYYNPEGLGSHANDFKSWDIRTSWYQKMPFARKLVSPFRILAPMMFESFDLSGYDLVISSSSAVYFSKAVITRPETLHISYIHTPPRYLYGYTTAFDYKKRWYTRVGGELINHFLRIYDFEISQRPDILVANSQNVADRIRKFYRRDSLIIYPPVEVENFKVKSKEKNGSYYLSLGRLVRGKGVDVIVEACSKLNLPLKVAGMGPQLEELKTMAGVSVEFLGEVKDSDREKLYQGAIATIVASEDEDFGIVPVESMACGTPVIAVRAGGFLETVVPGKTGEFFAKASSEELVNTLKTFNPSDFKTSDCREQAGKFSEERFIQDVLSLVEKSINRR